MDIGELRRRFDEAGRGGELAVSDVARTESDGLGNGVTVVEPVAGSTEWTTYFTERGAVLDQRFFDTETAACELVLAQLHHDLRSAATPPARRDPEAWERARALPAQADLEYREVLRSRGLDPDGRGPGAGGGPAGARGAAGRRRSG